MKKYAPAIVLWIVFETVAILLWQMKDNLFYLLNFSYIGCSLGLGVFLFMRGHQHARRIVQLLVGLYMLVYLGLICNENMQIEGFWYYLFTGVFEAATIHYRRGENLRAVGLRARLVWICLLDGNGVRFFAV